MELLSLEVELLLVNEEKNGDEESFGVEEPGEEKVESQPEDGVVGVDAPLGELKAFEVVRQVV